MVGITYYLSTGIISGVPVSISAAPFLSSLGISMLGTPAAPVVPIVGAGVVGAIPAAFGISIITLLSAVITSLGIIVAIPMMCGGMSFALLNVLTCGIAGTLSQSLTSIPFMGALLGSAGMGGGNELLFFMP